MENVTGVEGLIRDSTGLYTIFFKGKQEYSIEKLLTVFKEFGDVVDIKLLESKKAGFVKYNEYSEAEQCLKKVNGPIIYTSIPLSSRIRSSSKLSNGQDPNCSRNDNNKERQGQNPGQLGHKGFGIGGHSKKMHSDKTKTYGSKRDVDNDQKGGRTSSSIQISSTTSMEPLIDISSSKSLNYYNHVDDLESVPPLKSTFDCEWENGLDQIPDIEPVQVVISNLPKGIYLNEVVEMCTEHGASIVHIDILSCEHSYKMCYALVYMRSLKSAQHLVTSLNGLQIENRPLVVALSRTILDDYNKNSDEIFTDT